MALCPSESLTTWGYRAIIISREEITCCYLTYSKLVPATGYSCKIYIKTGTLPTISGSAKCTIKLNGSTASWLHIFGNVVLLLQWLSHLRMDCNRPGHVIHRLHNHRRSISNRPGDLHCDIPYPALASFRVIQLSFLPCSAVWPEWIACRVSISMVERDHRL
jgi:hypothetical protein